MAEQRDGQTYSLIGAAMAVQNELGHGFLETVYLEAMEVELGRRDIPFVARCPVPVHYKGVLLGSCLRVDLVCFGEVIVELKAIRELGPLEISQILHFLKASGLSRGLLINFGARSLDYRRFVF